MTNEEHRMRPEERRTAIGLAGIFVFRMLGLFMILPVLSLHMDTLEGATPLLIGVAIREFAPNAAAKLLPVVKKIGMLFLLIALALTLVLYGREMLGTVGSFAPGAQVLFFVAITAISYKIHFGLKQQQRSAMALGMCTRNIAALFAAFFGIANPPDGLFVMIVLAVPLSAIVAVVAARLFARQGPASTVPTN